MNSAKIERSPRLQRVLAYIQDGEPHSTLDIATNAYCCAVNSCVAELRSNGYDISCKRVGDVWYYQMKGDE